MIKIKCPKCNTPLEEPDYNLVKLIGQCPECNSVFQIDAIAAMRADKSYKQVTRPMGLDILKLPQKTEITIHHKYFDSFVFLYVLGVFLTVAIIYINFFTSSLVGKSLGSMVLQLVPLLFPTLLIYWATNAMLKKTRILITDNIVKFDTGSPLSWKDKSWHIKISAVNQIFVRRRVVKSDETTSTVYDLGVEGTNGQTSYPITDFKKSNVLYYIETYLEAHLGIEDQSHKDEAADTSFLPQNFREAISLARDTYKAYQEKDN